MCSHKVTGEKEHFGFQSDADVSIRLSDDAMISHFGGPALFGKC